MEKKAYKIEGMEPSPCPDKGSYIKSITFVTGIKHPIQAIAFAEWLAANYVPVTKLGKVTHWLKGVYQATEKEYSTFELYNIFTNV